MFKINKLLEYNCIEITNSITGSYCKIHLNQGASTQSLVLNDKEIIKDCYPLSYKDSYASAIMFPFASRIENGIYTFKEIEYVLEKNDEANNCALHGLVYNKAFTLLKQQSTKDFASVTLHYLSEEAQEGFPFKYELLVTYILTSNTLSTNITVRNLDTKSFPFSLGWHPYFCSSSLYDSFVSFTAEQQAIFDENLILKKFTDVKSEYELQIVDNELDDCFKLKGNVIYFKTPKYKIQITSNNNYVQLYTPKSRQFLAIEPITAPSNSFNNKVGLKTLKGEEEYKTNWKIELIN